jgi:hypothetical protein
MVMGLIVDVTKAKAITNDIRRAARSTEMAPFDAIIAKQIPGTDAQDAEAARQLLRDKYAAVQINIEAADDVASLKAIVEGLK